MNWSYNFFIHDEDTILDITFRVGEKGGSSYLGKSAFANIIFKDLKNSILKTIAENFKYPENLEIKVIRDKNENIYLFEFDEDRIDGTVVANARKILQKWFKEWPPEPEFEKMKNVSVYDWAHKGFEKCLGDGDESILAT